ncbi:MAG TPA: ABC transporter ATP-binding protein [Anaerolineales bacterium]|nr:export ABC transporter ATP-binding protein [Anaerolineae bacterium]HRK87537.1 ABC transporter ATP-binding protein [Anaerolineales bacterium]
MSYAIEVKNLKKSFGNLQAVQDATFKADSGEVLSLLGPNGAGKSTTISMLSGLLAPTGGDASIMGHSVVSEPESAKKSLGVVPQDIALYPDLSARENLIFWGKMYGLRGTALKQRVDEVLEIIGLVDRQKDHVDKFSGGMKRRVNIGAALLHKPDVIIMDEPTVGIDPQSRRHILDNVKELNRQGMTVLYTTHYMEEAAELSNHIAIMDKGRIIAYGTHDELIKLVGRETRIDITINAEGGRVLEAWRSTEGVARIDALDGTLTALVDDSNRVLPRLFDAASKVGVRIMSVDIQEPNLEMVFLHLTGRALRD